jgi:hypothetical protein
MVVASRAGILMLAEFKANVAERIPQMDSPQERYRAPSGRRVLLRLDCGADASAYLRTNACVPGGWRARH